MNKEEIKEIIFKNLEKMFDGVDDDGIYPTTNFLNDTTDEMLAYLQSQLTKSNNKIEKMEKDLKSGDLSDGYHTFNDLYYQRCILFATIVNQNKDISWKSKRHEDGQKCFNSDNWFIVGIDTPKGSYTYHYEAKYWDLFDCIELENGKHWDGHTERDVDRLLSTLDESDKDE